MGGRDHIKAYHIAGFTNDIILAIGLCIYMLFTIFYSKLRNNDWEKSAKVKPPAIPMEEKFWGKLLFFFLNLN